MLVAFAACSGPVVEGSVPQTLLSMPTDGTTGLNMAAISFQISPGPIDPETQSLLQTATTLVTWPDETVVASTIVPTSVPVGAFSIQAKAVVAAGWYAALLPRLPTSLRPAALSFHTTPDGRPAVRVHVGSAPALLRVDICGKGGGTIGDMTEVIVTFSEPVHAATTSTNPLSVSAGPATAAQPCASGEVPLADQMTGQYTYLCGAVGATDVVTISVTAGLLSADGVSVDIADHAILFGTLPASVAMAGCSSLEIDP
jgi:hypothetical protein